MFALYARFLGIVLVGYVVLNKTFAYIHIPGTPLFIGEMVLAVGLIAAVVATGDLRVPSRDSEKVLVVLCMFCVWGLILTVPGLVTFGIDAARDAALWYYSLFTFLTYSTVVRSPSVLDRWSYRFSRLIPWVLSWLLILLPVLPTLTGAGKNGSAEIPLVFKPGDVGISALLAIGYLWLFPGMFTGRARMVWILVGFGVVGLAGTQNRGGLIAVGAGLMVGLAFQPNRRALVKRSLMIGVAGLGLACLMPDLHPGNADRNFSAAQLIQNVMSLGDSSSGSQLNDTADFRRNFWARVLNKQQADAAVLDGEGFGPNLASAVGVYVGKSDSFRSPHNSHLDVLARMGVVGLFLWMALWIGWYWRVVTGCRRCSERGWHMRRQAGVLSLMVITAILISSYFDPQLEGPQMAITFWSMVGIGLAATSTRLDPGDRAPSLSPARAES